MTLALGAVSSALDALQSLTSSLSSQKSKGLSHPAPNPFDHSCDCSDTGSTPSAGANGLPQISPATLNALLIAQAQSTGETPASASLSPSDSLKDLFGKLDADRNGQISKSEFENALGAGGTNVAKADDVFGKLDKSGDGSVSLDELSSALRGRGHDHSHRAHHGGGNADGQGSDPLLQALQGASSTSVTNSDGSTTTSLTYADGSKVTLTSPVTGAGSSKATSSYNFIEGLIARQAQAIASSASAPLSVTV